MRPEMCTSPTAKEVRARVTASNRQGKTLIGIAMFVVGAICYPSLFVASLTLPWWPAQLLAAVLNGVVIFLLLCVGHDAAHGNLTHSHVLNNLIGRLAFLPSLTPYSIWAYTHNRRHHAFTNLRGYDIAFAPFSAEEFARLPAWRRGLERFYKSVPGLALYYLVEIWWKYVFAYRSQRKSIRTSVIYNLDRLIVISFVVTQVAAALRLQAIANPAEAESSFSVATGLLTGLVLPWLVFCWVIGFVSFLHHTHPKVRWYASRSEWTFFSGQTQGSVHVVFPWPRWFRLIHALFEHPAHHIDYRIPTVELRECEQQLEQAYPEVLVEQFSISYLRRLLATCQLYDYVIHQWLDFDGKPTSEPTGEWSHPAKQEPLSAIE